MNVTGLGARDTAARPETPSTAPPSSTAVRSHAASPSNSATPIRVVLVDDEPLALGDLRWLLDQAGEVDIVGEASSGEDALQVMGREPAVDCVFLDIQMSGIGGMELAELLAKFRRPPHIVFVTAHEEHALRAFEVNAVDYLTKPVDPVRLDAALARVRARLPSAEPAIVDDAAPCARLRSRVGDVTHVIERDDVVYAEASGDYVRVHHAGGSHLVRETISTLEAAWERHGFLRIHRSFLVRESAITQIRTVASGQAVVVGEAELPVSRRHRRALRDRLAPRSRPG